MTTTTISHPRRPALSGLALLAAGAAAALSVVAIVTDDVGTPPQVNVVTPAGDDVTPTRADVSYVDDCSKGPLRSPRPIAC
jgi:hypothetical protein